MIPGIAKLYPSLSHFSKQPGRPMRWFGWLVAGNLLTWCVPAALSGSTERSQFLNAKQLENQRKFTEAVRILEPMVESKADVIDDAERGFAFNLLGPAYEGLGKYPNALHCYEMQFNCSGSYLQNVVSTRPR